ncbi:hypothetical protein BVY03_01405 [bacterium K02(2017)]|nr:hypothetical protein BVY03_01405 [bacterium K02(2017)]
MKNGILKLFQQLKAYDLNLLVDLEDSNITKLNNLLKLRRENIQAIEFMMAGLPGDLSARDLNSINTLQLEAEKRDSQIMLKIEALHQKARNELVKKCQVGNKNSYQTKKSQIRRITI